MKSIILVINKLIFEKFYQKKKKGPTLTPKKISKYVLQLFVALHSRFQWKTMNDVKTRFENTYFKFF